MRVVYFDMKNSFILYNDLLPTVEKLPDETAGKLFKMILQFANGDNPTTDDLVLDVTFGLVQQQIKRDTQKYSEYIKKQRDNGKRGGRPKKPEVIQETQKTQPFLEKPKKADNDNVSVNENVNGNDKEKKETTKEKEAAPSSLEMEFNLFWEGCHVQRGSRSKALTSWERMRKKKLTELSVLEITEAYNKLVATKNEDEQQFIPHQVTWLNQQRWDEKLPEPPKKFPFTLDTLEWVWTALAYPELTGTTVYYEVPKKGQRGRIFDHNGNHLDKIFYDDEGWVCPVLD